MDALKKINWKQPKYMIPLIIYFPLLFVGYFVIDLFHTEKAEIPDGLTTTEYLNPDLPDAKMKGDGIGNKYESMLKSYGKIDDYSAVGNIERNEEDTKEEYDTKYSDEERKQVEAQEAEKLSEMQRQLQESAQKGQEIAKGNNSAENDRLARGKQREQEAMEELNRAIAQARIQAQQVSTPSMQAEVTAKTGDAKEGKVEIPEKKKTNDEPQAISISSSASSKPGFPAAGTVQGSMAIPMERTLAMTFSATALTSGSSAPCSALAPAILWTKIVPATPRRPVVYKLSWTATSSLTTT